MEIGIALLFIIGSLLLLRRSKKSALPIAIYYLLAVVNLAFLIREPMSLYHYTLRPFTALRNAIEFGGSIVPGLLTGFIKVKSWESLKGVLLNILLFVPCGFLVPTIWKRSWSCWKVVLLGFSVSLCIETIQFLTRCGYADVDDLINNTIGTWMGYILYKYFLKDQQT